MYDLVFPIKQTQVAILSIFRIAFFEFDKQQTFKDQIYYFLGGFLLDLIPFNLIARKRRPPPKVARHNTLVKELSESQIYSTRVRARENYSFMLI